LTAPGLLTTVRRHDLGHDPRRLPGPKPNHTCPNHNLGTFGRVVSSSASFAGPHEVRTRAADLVGAMDHLLRRLISARSHRSGFLARCCVGGRRYEPSIPVASGTSATSARIRGSRVGRGGVRDVGRCGPARRRVVKTRGDPADRAAAQPALRSAHAGRRGGDRARARRGCGRGRGRDAARADGRRGSERRRHRNTALVIGGAARAKSPASHRPSWRSSGSARLGSHPEGRAPRSARSASPWRIGRCRWSEPSRTESHAPVPGSPPATRRSQRPRASSGALQGADDADHGAMRLPRRTLPVWRARGWLVSPRTRASAVDDGRVVAAPEPATRKGRQTRDRIVAIAAELIYRRGGGRHPKG
jgi:hypothetical protein